MIKPVAYLLLLMGGGCCVVKVVGMSYAVYQNCVETQKDIASENKHSKELQWERENGGIRRRPSNTDGSRERIP